MRNIVVTGASGYLGNVLCQLLQQEGYHVTAVALDATSAKSLARLNIKKIDADIRDFDKILPIFNNQDAVFHLASAISILKDSDKKMHSVNVEGLKTVAEASLQAKVERFIHLSSIHALSAYPIDKPINELRGFALSPNDLDYDKTKAMAELALKKFIDRGLNAIVVNPTGFVGPYDFEPSLTGDAIHTMFRSKRLTLHLPGGFNFIDVRDVAQTLINVINKGKVGERYILAGEWISVTDMVDLVAQARGYKGMKLQFPLFLAQFFVRLKLLYWKITGERVLYSNQSLRHLKFHRYVDDSKARNELDHKTRPLLETFVDIYKWMMSNAEMSHQNLK